MQLETLRTAVEAFTTALQRGQYRHHAGFEAELDLEGVYREHADLFRTETLDDLARAEQATPEFLGSRRKALAKLRGFVVEHALDRAAAPLDREIARVEDSTSIAWGGRTIRLRRLDAALAREADPSSRRRLAELGGNARGAADDLRRERRRVTEAAARGLGLAGLLEARRLTSGVDLTALGLGMERLLEATRADYLGRLGASLERRLGTAAAERCDVPFWRRTDDVDPFFEAEGLVPAVAATLRALGIDPDRQPGLEIDLERRRGKSSRAFCAPVRIPHEIKIVLLPRGGQDDYAALLHEMGHAQHFVWTSPDTPAEHRVVGDRALGEGYAALLERLAATEAWVRPRLGERTAAFLGSRALDRAHAVRREAARFLFDLRSISAAPPGDPDRDYAELLGEATGFGYHGTSHLEDADGELSGQAYLRGWMLESALGEYLRERFGTSWFASRQAGDLLKEIWNSGQLYTADELARELGLGGLDPDRLAEDLRAGLRR